MGQRTHKSLYRDPSAEKSEKLVIKKLTNAKCCIIVFGFPKICLFFGNINMAISICFVRFLELCFPDKFQA